MKNIEKTKNKKNVSRFRQQIARIAPNLANLGGITARSGRVQWTRKELETSRFPQWTVHWMNQLSRGIAEVNIGSF